VPGRAGAYPRSAHLGADMSPDILVGVRDGFVRVDRLTERVRHRAGAMCGLTPHRNAVLPDPPSTSGGSPNVGSGTLGSVGRVSVPGATERACSPTTVPPPPPGGGTPNPARGRSWAT